MRSATAKKTGKDPARLEWIRTLPCVACVGMECFLRLLAGAHTWGDIARIHQRQRFPSESAHVGDRGLSQKCPDSEAIPLCSIGHHREGKYSAHVLGCGFWRFHGLDKEALIKELNRRYEERG